MVSVNRGDRLAGRFLLVRPLGAARSRSWAAEDTVSGERCVVRLAAATARAQLESEAEQLRRAAHPGVVRLLGRFDDGELALLATEYLPGGDLSALRGAPWREIATALLPALVALEHLAGLGLAHGDLKPANLVRGSDGGARLIDFEVAASAASGAITRGSPYGRSPAQLAGVPPTPADDSYGLGALLYELLGGAPPGYPAQPLAEAPDAVPAPIGAERQVPPALLTLMSQLLDHDPQARPSPAAVRELLVSLLERDPAPRAEARGPPLAPPPRPVAAPAWTPVVAAGTAAPRRRRRASPSVIAASVLLLAAAGVFVLLPQWAPRLAPEVTMAPQAPSAILAARNAAAPKALPTTPEGLAALAAAKTHAEEARERYSTQRAAAESAHAELWGGSDFTRFGELAGAGARQYDARDYAAAKESYEAAATLAAHVRGGRGAALAAALGAGKAAFARGESAAALRALQQALAIEPKEHGAASLLARAEHLDQVQALLDAGAALERSGELAAAASRYRDALALDAASTAANAGLARLGARERANAFAAAMASGQRQLAVGDRAGARAAFERAATIAPQSPEARDELAQLDGLDRSASIAQLKSAAEAAIAAERWAEAQSAYGRALGLDSALAFARAGREAVAPRAVLAARLDGFLDQPERLYAVDGRGGARAALTEARAMVAAPGPVLRGQIERLERALSAAETPVRLALASDGLTEVVVYRVGRFGTFGAREIELLPGQYTIVGTRPGYRDVRREVHVAPGAPMTAPVEVRCTEPI